MVVVVLRQDILCSEAKLGVCGTKKRECLLVLICHGHTNVQ
jgi:hypothetical protein